MTLRDSMMFHVVLAKETLSQEVTSPELSLNERHLGLKECFRGDTGTSSHISGLLAFIITIHVRVSCMETPIYRVCNSSNDHLSSNALDSRYAKLQKQTDFLIPHVYSIGWLCCTLQHSTSRSSNSDFVTPWRTVTNLTKSYLKSRYLNVCLVFAWDIIGILKITWYISEYHPI